MKEQEFENIICKYPVLIEDGLSFRGRQVNIKGKFVDLLFEDRHGQTLIIELKRGNILRKHIAQLLDYEGHFLTLDDPTVRVMLVGNRVPNNLRRSLDHHGFEWKEISTSFLIRFLEEKNDEEFLNYFPKEESELVRTAPVKDRSSEIKSRTGISSQSLLFWNSLMEKANKKTHLFSKSLFSKSHVVYANVGITGMKWAFSAPSGKNAWVELEISISGNPQETDRVYDKLFNQRERIERNFGEPLLWEKIDRRLACRIKSFSKVGGFDDTEKWDELQNDLVDRMIRFERSFKDTIGVAKRNLTRQNIARRIRNGTPSKQATLALQFLEEADHPVTMDDFVSYMKLMGYKSKTYYDLFNALIDLGLVESSNLQGKTAYKIVAKNLTARG